MTDYAISPPLFFDGEKWISLIYNPKIYTICIKPENKNAMVKYDDEFKVYITENKLFILYDKGKKVVQLEIIEEKNCFHCKSNKLQSKFHDMEILDEIRGITTVKRRIDKVNNKYWDMIADFVNRIFD